jgi:hypothetical protein
MPGAATNNRFSLGRLPWGSRSKRVFWFTDALTPGQLIELAQRTEQLGYAALWYITAA